MTHIKRPEGSRLGAWIDQDLDSGSGIQVEICPDVFTMADDGLTYTHIGRVIFGRGYEGMVPVPKHIEDQVIEAVQEDPGEVTYIEFIKTDDDGFVSEVWDAHNEVWVSFVGPKEPLTDVTSVF